jgi:DNA-binding NtrC family response regulator
MPLRRPKILVVDDEADALYSFRRVFERSDYVILEAQSGREALQQARDELPDVILMDIRMPGLDGLATLREIRAIDPRIPVILMTAYASTKSTIEAMKAGAFDYVIKPFDVEAIRAVVQAAVKVSLDMRQVVSYEPLRSKEKHEEEIVGSSEPMQEVYKLIGRLSNSDLPVLITGESGTGKEMVARAIYHHSRRNRKPFLAVNCAAIPENLLEGELFGFHKGAFTGATTAKPGKFEVCDGGTIFLDEIAEMPSSTQGKLLRVLETGEIEKLGSTRTVKVDVRVLAATNKNLPELIEAGRFRADLFYRLRVVEIPLPPLRERLSDVPTLVTYFLERHGPEFGHNRVTVDAAAMNALMRHHYPGNVRELENILKNSLLRLKGNVLRAEDLDFGITPRRLLPLPPPQRRSNWPTIPFSTRCSTKSRDANRYPKDMMPSMLWSSVSSTAPSSTGKAISQRPQNSLASPATPCASGSRSMACGSNRASCRSRIDVFRDRV